MADAPAARPPADTPAAADAALHLAAVRQRPAVAGGGRAPRRLAGPGVAALDRRLHVGAERRALHPDAVPDAGHERGRRHRQRAPVRQRVDDPAGAGRGGRLGRPRPRRARRGDPRPAADPARHDRGRQAGRDGRARRRRPARAQRPVERAARQRGRGAAAGQRPGRAAPDVRARDRLRRRGRLRLLHRPGAARGVSRRPGPLVAGGVDAPAGAADRRAGHHVPAHARLDGTASPSASSRRRPTGAPPRARRCGSSACTRCSPAASSSTSRRRRCRSASRPTRIGRRRSSTGRSPAPPPLARTALAALVASFAVAVAAFLWNARRPAARARTPQRGGVPRRSLWVQVVTATVARTPAVQAGFFFALRTLGRSVPHRAALAVASAFGLAVATIGFGRAMRAPAGDAAVQALLWTQTMFLASLLAGLRTGDAAARAPAGLLEPQARLAGRRPRLRRRREARHGRRRGRTGARAPAARPAVVPAAADGARRTSRSACSCCSSRSKRASSPSTRSPSSRPTSPAAG